MKLLFHTFFLILTIWFLGFYEMNAQTFTWAKSISSSVGVASGRGIAVDIGGNSFITGYFQGTASVGTYQMISHGGQDIFVAKFGPDGNCLWVNNSGGPDFDAGSSISVDKKGNCYVTGYFIGDVTFGTYHLTSYGGQDIFIVKYDPNGNCLWARHAGSKTNGMWPDEGQGISTDNKGNCYVTGSFSDTATFGTIHLAGQGYNDIFISKYNTDGNILWAKLAGGKLDDEGCCISSDANGNSFLSGYFQGVATFDTLTLNTFGSDDIFIARYDSNGNCLWAKQAGGTKYESSNGICVDEQGSLYITGYFSSDIATFGDIQLTNSTTNNSDIFLSKYDYNGNCIWAKSAGGPLIDYGFGVAVDSNKNSFVTGAFEGTAVFDTIKLNSNGSYDIFIAKYDSGGRCQWAKNAGNINSDFGMAIAIDSKGDRYFTGEFNGAASFGTIGIFATPSYGVFIVKNSEVSVPVELSSFAFTTVNNAVRLDWETITETNNNFFNIERRSPNGLWESIGLVKGAGNSLLPIKYLYFDKELLPNGNYYYRLKQIDYNGQYKYSKEIEVEINLIPKEYSLQQNYPNPFNPSTVISYSLPSSSNINLVVYNTLGQTIKTLESGYKPAGNYSINFNASALPSGIYFYKLEAGSFSQIKKMILIK
jgi:hypothetical protein